MRTSLPTAALAIALATALGGCVVYPARPGYVAESAIVTVAPPAPEVEIHDVAPVAGYVWIGGYWNWVGGRHTWVAGHWEAPRPGHRWVPHTWVRAQGGWRLDQGHWERH